MNRRRGQGIVEFALILPVLLLVILGLIEAAFVIQGYLAVQHAAREAARFAVTYQPFQGACLNDKPAPYPYCPRDGGDWPGEPDDQYYARRVELIKLEARRAAAGLRIDDAHLGDSPSEFELYQDRPGFFGVLVWGYPSFLTDCDADPDQCADHPGLEGLPVRVLVRHNVEVLDPLYRAIVEYVPVRADTQMINEGVQVGFGNVPPPDFSTNPDLDEPPVDPPVDPTDESTEEPPLEPANYFVELNVEHATNAMPDDRAHQFIATVTNETGQEVQGARVSFSTDKGGFSYSGSDPQYVEELTGSSGQAAVTLYGNRPVTATIRAWLDYNGDNLWEPGEPNDDATKTWTVSGPYIVVSDYEVYPEVDTINVDVMDHDSTDNPHRLLWCVISGTTPSGVVRDALNVDAGGDAFDLDFGVPADSRGVYRMETHTGGGECGSENLIAYSAPISVVVLPPDLAIASLDVPDLICPETVFTMSVAVENRSPGSTDQIFDVDFFLNPEPTPPRSPIGQRKQWVSGIGPYETVVLTTAMWVGSTGDHQIWARVDTSNYVDEGWNEDNNAKGITITTGTVAGTLVDTGWRSPTANAADSGGDGDGFEVDPQNAYGDGGGHAESHNNGTSTNHTERHRYYNYGFDVPDDATIHGIEVRLDWWLDSTYGTNIMGVDLSWDGGAHWTSVRTDGTEDTSEHSVILGGADDTWGRTWLVDEFSAGNFRARVHAYSSSRYRDIFLDWVPVRVTYVEDGECAEGDDPPPWGEDDIRPPGLVECEQLLQAGGFEGNPQSVFAPSGPWNPGEPLAYKHQSRYIYEGSMSMRLHASMGSYPECPAYHPYLWQTVTIPDEVYTTTTIFVQGKRLVAGSLAPCSNADSAEADDRLYVEIESDQGTPSALVVDGGVVTETWQSFEEDFTEDIDLVSLAGQDVQVRFYAEHDEDYYDTWFYLDALKCEVCTGWPIPDPEPGTASIGGDVRVLVGGFPQTLQGVDVWAYSPGEEVLHTITIQDGTYHFYNVPPGSYTIYAEVWVGGGLRFGTTTVTVVADERNDGVDLLLL